MKAKWFLLFWLFFGLAAVQMAVNAHPGFHLLDLRTGKEAGLSETASELSKNRIVLIGEHHTNRQHHKGQLAVIQSLQGIGTKVAIGLEMFRTDGQSILDRWVTGELSQTEMARAFESHWRYPFELYADIFHFARREKIPMVALNVSAAITRKVAKSGFASLTEKQRAQLPNIVCDVSASYRDFIRSAYGAHAHGQGSFEYFCEAQLVWDNAMAHHARQYLIAHTRRVMVLLAGSAHAQKKGIPARVKQLGALPLSVILPETKGSIMPGQVTTAQADFILR